MARGGTLFRRYVILAAGVALLLYSRRWFYLTGGGNWLQAMTVSAALVGVLVAGIIFAFRRT